MNNFSDNSTMVEERARREPKSLKEIALLKLIHMLIERLIPRILRSYRDMDSAGGFDEIKKEVLALRDWIYEPLSCSVASDVYELIIKMFHDGGLIHSSFNYVRLLVLHPKCHNLSFDFFPYDMIGDVIDMLESLIYLEQMEWTEQLEEKETDQFTTSLKYYTRLKVFVHKPSCNDEIIKVLSENCPMLSVLDVSYSTCVTDESTGYIENMKSLKKCNIKETSITIEGFARILKNCTQLCQLDTSYNICNILGSFEDADHPIQLSLTTVELYDYPITPSLLKKYCPFLRHIDVRVKWGSEPPCHLSSVERLTIVDLSCCYSALDTWLILENINVITLVRFGMSDEDLVELSNACQNITELYVEVFNVKSHMHSFSEHRPFQKLKILKFVSHYDRPNRFREKDASIFKILLSYSTMITHVDIINLCIDDYTVETIFKTNKMRYLQYWKMEPTVCTSDTFYLLFDMCPMLKFIGKLRTWDIDPDKVQEIKNFIRQENYNLDIDISDTHAILIRYVDRAKALVENGA